MRRKHREPKPPGRFGPAPQSPHLGGRLVASLDLVALFGAMVFAAASLTPTLLPRTAMIQGALTGALTMIGYGLCGLLLRVFRWQRAKTGFFTMPEDWKWFGWWVALVLSIVITLVGSPLWLSSQNDLRRHLGMPQLGYRAMINMVLIAVVVGLICLIIGRLLTGLFGWIMKISWRHTGPIGSRAIATVAALALGLLFFNQVIYNGVYNSVYSSYEQGDNGTDPGAYQPTSPLDSGGPGSLTPWDTLGLQGRNFAGTATPVDKLQKFAGDRTKAMQPIRVYAGLKSAPTPEARAKLAVAELERTGAFKRSVLVVCTATGTGWVDPYAASAVEYLTGGNSAIVSMQYSFLPSWIAFITERSTASQAGRLLLNAVAEKWNALPEGARPKLVIFGESLGSYGAEAGLATSTLTGSLNALAAHGSSALFVGPTEGNPIWRQVQSNRVSSSPVWRAVLPTKDQVTVSNHADQIPATSQGAAPVQYVAHGDDPVTWWSMSSLWMPPQWVTGPTPPSVPNSVIWFPVVTWLQTAADLMAGFSAPVGYGHNYNDAFASGFASVAAPADWTAADTAHLATTLDHLNDADKNSSGS